MLAALLTQLGAFPPVRWVAKMNQWARERCEMHFRSATREYDVDPMRAFGIAFSDVSLKASDGVALRAWYVPGHVVGAGPRGAAAVVHHHFAGQKATTLDWIRGLHKHGVDVLAIDACGHGRSQEVAGSRGSFGKRAADVNAAVAWLAGRGAAPIIGVGRSQGAAAIAMAACASRAMAGVVLESGPAAGMLSATWGLAGQLVASGEPRWRRYVLALYLLGASGPFRYALAIWWALARLRRTPMIWVHGEIDRVIPRSSANLWFRALKRVDSPWREVSVLEAGHLRCLAIAPERILGEVMQLIAECTVTSHGTVQGEGMR